MNWHESVQNAGHELTWIDMKVYKMPDMNWHELTWKCTKCRTWIDMNWHESVQNAGHELTWIDMKVYKMPDMNWHELTWKCTKCRTWIDMNWHESVENAGNIDKSWQTIAVSEIHLSFLWNSSELSLSFRASRFSCSSHPASTPNAGEPWARSRAEQNGQSSEQNLRSWHVVTVVATNCVAYPMVILFVHLCSQGNSTTFNMFPAHGDLGTRSIRETLQDGTFA